MALTWVEDRASRSATIVRLGRRAASSYSRSYKVFGTTDDVELHADANARISSSLAFWQYPARPNVQLRAESYSVTYLGDDAWQVTINYEKNGADDDDQQNPLKRSRSFDTSGGTSHITQSPLWNQYNTVTIGGVVTITPVGNAESKYPSSAPNQYGAIGVDDNGVNGVDIVTPALTWTETYDVPSSYVTTDYIKRTAFQTGTVNNDTFRTFAAGEVLFLGCTGGQEWDAQRGDGPWSLSYKFVASPNCGPGQTMPALSVGDISNISKKGHDYMWVRYQNTESNYQLLKQPKHVYVNQVYRSSNFAALGIGVT